MTISIWFDYQPVLDKLLPSEAAAKLREVGEKEVADVLETAQGTQYQKFGIRDRLCAHIPRVSCTNPASKRFDPYPACGKYRTWPPLL